WGRRAPKKEHFHVLEVAKLRARRFGLG
ncbi:hypothetical protein A2U01_0101550, partial [Trifolium medium]|nr:hypothetical protein [Trifolium medium]